MRMSQMEIFWLIAVVAFGVLEAFTFQFISIWFAGGALVSMLAALLGAPVWAQCVIFIAVTVVLLLTTAPLVKKVAKQEKTNADSLIGKSVVMTKATDALGDGGEAKAGGTVWTVRTLSGDQIQKDEVVTVEKIEGVKLIVRK